MAPLSNRFACVHVFANRVPMIHRAGWEGRKTDNNAIAYAWYIWDAHHRGDTEMRRIWWEP